MNKILKDDISKELAFFVRELAEKHNHTENPAAMLIFCIICLQEAAIKNCCPAGILHSLIDECEKKVEIEAAEAEAEAIGHLH